MKNKIIIYLLFIGSLTFWSLTANAQAILSTIDGPTDSDPSAMLEISSNNSGLLIPKVTLNKLDDGTIISPSIPVTPADGLIIFHDGSNDIDKGLWFYDAVIPKWVFFTDFTSVLSEQSLDDFAEMYETQDLGSGTTYALSKDYYIPWASGEPGLKGVNFLFIDSEDVTVATGVVVPADRYQINSQGEAIYSVVISATLASTTPMNTVTGQLFVNDIKVDNIFFRHTFQLKDKPTNLKTIGNIQLGPGDKVDFRFISDVKNNGVEVENLNIRFSKLGDL